MHALQYCIAIQNSKTFHSLKKSRSRQFWKLKSRINFPGLVLYSLDKFHLGLSPSLKIYSLSLGLDIDIGTEKVSVSVSTLRPGFPKSQSRSRDSNLSIANPWSDIYPFNLLSYTISYHLCHICCESHHIGDDLVTFLTCLYRTKCLNQKACITG